MAVVFHEKISSKLSFNVCELKNAMYCTYHLLPRESTPGTHANPGGNGTVLVFLFSQRGGELFSFGNDFAGPRGHTHGICLSFGQRYIALDQSFLAPFYFLSMPNFDIMLWVFIPLPKEGLFVINFMPFT